MSKWFLSGLLIVALVIIGTSWAAERAATRSAPAAAPSAAPTPSAAPSTAAPSSAAAPGAGRSPGDAGGLPAPAAKAPTAAATPTAGPRTVADDLARLLNDPTLGRISTSARVVALAEPATRDRAEVLFELRPGQPLIPASTMKLLTTAACLDRLGPGWRIRTHVGRIPAAGRKDVWDLGVIGGGDPNISGRFYAGDSVGAFRKWAEVLRSRDVRSLGRIVLDDSLFEPTLQHPHWPADQLADWYAAPAGAINLNDNCVDIHVSAGAKAGDPAVIRIDPPGAYASVAGTIVTVANRAQHSFSLDRIVEAGPSPRIRIKAAGRYWVGAPEAVESRTVADPAIFFGLALAEALKAEGLAVEGPVVRERLTAKDGSARPDFTCDIIHTSRLDATVTVADKRSQGLYAECLLKLLGAYGPTPDCTNPLPPRQGSWVNGAAEVRRWMGERGIPADGVIIDDGSGLSKDNRLTALAVTELLAVMYARHGETFVKALAVAGEDGSLTNRMRNTPAEGRVYGKTGYVFGASALSGYVRARSGRMIAYSVIMNDVPWGELWKARLAQDKVCIRLVDY